MINTNYLNDHCDNAYMFVFYFNTLTQLHLETRRLHLYNCFLTVFIATMGFSSLNLNLPLPFPVE